MLSYQNQTLISSPVCLNSLIIHSAIGRCTIIILTDDVRFTLWLSSDAFVCMCGHLSLINILFIDQKYHIFFILNTVTWISTISPHYDIYDYLHQNVTVNLKCNSYLQCFFTWANYSLASGHAKTEGKSFKKSNYKLDRIGLLKPYITLLHLHFFILHFYF